ncbi:MAG: DNA polymerase III subunit delta' C-terminal domain-containing protein, partial [Patescibacteria group bacterium]
IYNALVEKGAKRDAALEMARLAFGSPGRALDLLANQEKLKFFKKERERFWTLLKDGLAERLSHLANLFSSKDDHMEARDKLIEILQIWQTLWRDILSSKQGAGELVANISEEEEIKKQAKRYSGAQIAGVIKKIEDSAALLRQNVNPKLIIENLILSFY